MKGFDNPDYFFGLLISNITAILFLIFAFHWPKISRVLFFLLFSWACWVNWKTALQDPNTYLGNAELTFSDFYKDFIYGWFSQHILLTVGFIATCEGLIAISMFMRGWIFKTGAIGAIIFLFAIVPLGVGSGFPCTIIFATAMFVLLKKREQDYLWKIHKTVIT